MYKSWNFTFSLQGFIHLIPTQTDDIHSLKLVASLQCVCAVVVNKPTSLLSENKRANGGSTQYYCAVNIFPEEILTNKPQSTYVNRQINTTKYCTETPEITTLSTWPSCLAPYCRLPVEKHLTNKRDNQWAHTFSPYVTRLTNHCSVSNNFEAGFIIVAKPVASCFAEKLVLVSVLYYHLLAKHLKGMVETIFWQRERQMFSWPRKTTCSLFNNLKVSFSTFNIPYPFIWLIYVTLIAHKGVNRCMVIVVKLKTLKYHANGPFSLQYFWHKGQRRCLQSC